MASVVRRLIFSQLLTSLGLVIIQSPGDGHCLLHSVITSVANQFHWNISFEKLLIKLYDDVISNSNEYLMFLPSLGSEEALLQSLISYMFSKNYNQDFGDIIPRILANALNINFKIFFVNS